VPVLTDKPLTVSDYVRHARRFGGLQSVWDSAVDSLSAADLLILASELRNSALGETGSGFLLS